jgi:hypothetical protein
MIKPLFQLTQQATQPLLPQVSPATPWRSLSILTLTILLAKSVIQITEFYLQEKLFDSYFPKKEGTLNLVHSKIVTDCLYQYLLP